MSKATRALRLSISQLLVFTFLLTPLVLTQAKSSLSVQQKNTSKPEPASEVKGFIIEMLDGMSTCRETTAEELPLTLKREYDRGIPADILLPFQRPMQSGGLTINFNVLAQLAGRPDMAQVVAAFRRAADVWATRIKNPITITLDIDYGPKLPNGDDFPTNVLGSTRSEGTLIDYSGARTNLLAGSSGTAETAIYNLLPQSFVPTDIGNGGVVEFNRSVAFALGIPVPNPSDTKVATISFNSNFPYDLNPDDGINGSQTDFNAVAVHEIGHALGFTSNNGGGAIANISAWDLFRFRPGTAPANFSTAPRVLSKGGAQSYFTTQSDFVFGGPGMSELPLSTGGPLPNDGGDNRQSSHWKDDDLSGIYIGIMDPSIAPGVRRLSNENDFKAIESMGWNLLSSVAPPPAPPAPPAPVNDNFSGAQVLAGCSGTAAGVNVGAHREAGEPIHSPDNVSSNRSVWYMWQAPGSGSVTVTTAGSGFDTVLGVYIGTSFGSLTTLGRHDDGVGDDKTSSVTFNATAGNIYRFAVDGYNNANAGGDFGSLKINWTAPASGCTTNPIDSASYFVRQQYLDFLNREPDASGLNFWTNEITSCGSDTQCVEVKRINVSAAFFLSIEYQQTGFLVERMYRVAYGEAQSQSTFPTPHPVLVPIVQVNEFQADKQQIGDGIIVGAPGWEAALEAKKSSYVTDFAGRSRFTTAYPLSMTPAQFVDALNSTAGNPLSAGERNALVNDLTNATKTRAQVVRAIAEDADLINAETNKAFVLTQFIGYLRRNPNGAPDSDHTGFDFWLGKLNQFGGNFVNAEMVKSFLVSSEYRNRFND